MEPLQVKSMDAEAKRKRAATCNQVLEYLGVQPAQYELLCFIDEETVEDVTFEEEKNKKLGLANRGFFAPDTKSTLENDDPPLPCYVKTCIRSASGEILFQRLIYVTW